MLISILALVGSGCSKPVIHIAPIECPDFDIYEPPVKFWLQAKALGTVTVHDDDRNTSTSDVYVNLRGEGSHSMKSAYLIHGDIINSLGDYINELLIIGTKYRNQRLSLEHNKTK